MARLVNPGLWVSMDSPCFNFATPEGASCRLANPPANSDSKVGLVPPGARGRWEDVRECSRTPMGCPGEPVNALIPSTNGPGSLYLRKGTINQKWVECTGGGPSVWQHVYPFARVANSGMYGIAGLDVSRRFWTHVVRVALPRALKAGQPGACGAQRLNQDQGILNVLVASASGSDWALNRSIVPTFFSYNRDFINGRDDVNFRLDSRGLFRGQAHHNTTVAALFHHYRGEHAKHINLVFSQKRVMPLEASPNPLTEPRV
uniref:Uncharacterized protein n=1 Tax=Haptolina brevifila TaxID=156173 RepID=A0A7S2GPX4_9EUKA